jgi:hypothetical protein
VQGTTELHHEITDTGLPEAEPIFHYPTPLDTAVDVFNPPPAMM